MISAAPSFSVRTLSHTRPGGVESFIEQYARGNGAAGAGTERPVDTADSETGSRAKSAVAFEYTFYGSGKVALRDGLATFVDPGQNVLLPAYLPDAVVEPFHELGLEPRYYRVEPSFAPDLEDVKRRIDADTAAVMSVNYFGFPQPGLDDLMELIADYDCYHVDDNAHAPISVDDGTLLGTRGHVGITSLWKMLPIPNGAILYQNDPETIERYEPSSIAGVRDSLDIADCQFIAKSTVQNLISGTETLQRSLDALFAGHRIGTSTGASTATETSDTPAVGGPHERYEDGKTQMSKLAAYIMNESDPQAIRSRRRENYRTWQRVLADRDGVEVVFESLPAEICPQALPVRADDPQRFLTELDRCGAGGAYPWPRLSTTVLEDSDYETATRLSREIIALPIHQHVEPSTIEAVGRTLQH